MTQQRKNRLKHKIQESRGRLMESHPFFALLLMYLKFVAVPGMKKISTNGRCIYFSPDFADKLYEDELEYILCHQIMHIVCGDIWRPDDREGDNYHFACDIRVNSYLTNHGFKKERYPHLGEVHIKVPGEYVNLANLSAEEIFEILPYNLSVFDDKIRSKFLMDNDLWWSQKEDLGKSGELILDIPEMEGLLKAQTEVEVVSSTDAEELRREWHGRAALAVKSMQSTGRDDNGFGDVPDFVKRMIEKMQEPTIDWKKILNNFIQERICDYSFLPPDRRFADTDFFLPDFNENDFICKEVLFMADTSCSIRDRELAIVYSEIKGAIEQFGGKLIGKIGFFDTDVTPPLPFESVSDLMKIIPSGGGGTDFRVIFEYLRENCSKELPACVVIFTDGDGPYPDKAEALGVPVLWVINNQQFTPPWGKVVRNEEK